MLTAVEAFLVSLYGYRPRGDPSAEKQLSHETAPAPSDPSQTEVPRPDDEQSARRDGALTTLKDAPRHGDTAKRTDASLDQTSNSSSSSSVAEDWIVNHIPTGLESNLSLHDDQSCTQTAETGSASRPPEDPEVRVTSAAADTSKGQFSAEDWSRGTALTDPVSGGPLQPVKVHQPSKSRNSEAEEGQSSSKKMLNTITEKRAALTAYDLISNRAMRAPLSPAALFEKEARAEVLREKPAASLQDISAAVHERWKNLREEDRKK